MVSKGSICKDDEYWRRITNSLTPPTRIVDLLVQKNIIERKPLYKGVV